MTARLKLKRGLSDISPLFVKESSAPPETSVAEASVAQPRWEAKAIATTPEVCFIWSVDDESDAHFLNNYFASKMVAPNASSLLMTLEDEKNTSAVAVKPEPWSRSLHRIRLPAARVQEAFQQPEWNPAQFEEKTGTQIFLEMSKKSLFANPELIRLLDHVVLFLKPQIDSVTEAYRQLKRLSAMEMKADVTILFDADDAGGLSSQLYELFSEFTSRRLSFAMNYLGTLHLSKGGEGLRQDISWKSWDAVRTSRPVCIEKMHFLSWIEKLNKEKAEK